ncbi:SIMPL domain-containing protein [Trinickia sp. NRRL B-1857]|uniref:SIMPL domain-containing protein n=1 Tax=Trinickia sp. NRRL B-1857 TaxID=3162879 RepID=UPI003D287616
MRKTIAALSFAAALPLALTAVPSSADTVVTQSAPSGVLSLSAQATREVPQDTVEITLFYEQEASDPTSLTSALNNHAETALAQAKRVSEVQARTGTFSIYPSTDRDGRISAWRGRTEIVLKSHDFGTASRLAGDLGSVMQVGNVTFSLSPEAQRAVAQSLAGQAIQNFREQAQTAAKAFGYSAFTIREVDVNSNSGSQPRPMFAMRAMAAEAKAAAPVPVEGGTSTVTVNVSGSVQMTR